MSDAWRVPTIDESESAKARRIAHVERQMEILTNNPSGSGKSLIEDMLKPNPIIDELIFTETDNDTSV